MGDFLHAMLILGCVLLPFIAMPLLWRRMKRVRHQAYQDSRERVGTRAAAWEETADAADGLGATRKSNPNDDLIELGDRGRHSRWPLDNN
ncbi:hypothetical protein [Sphingomonas koreensis]